VVITGRNLDGKGESIAAEIGATFVIADHTNADDCARAVVEAVAVLGRVHALFNNAGLVLRGTAETTTEDEWAETMALNVTAPWRMTRLLIPHFREHGGGVIVNNSSDWVILLNIATTICI